MTEKEIAYIKDNYSPLKRGAEYVLFLKYQTEDPEYLAGRLYKHNLKLILWVVNKINGLEVDDGLSKSWEVILKCVKSYDYKRGARFTTYFTRYLKTYLIRHRDKLIKNVPLSLDAELAEDFTLLDSFAVETPTDYEYLYQAIEELGEMDVKIVTMYLEGYDFVEIGKSLGYTKQYMHKRFSNLLVDLKFKLTR